jgi:ferredoxin
MGHAAGKDVYGKLGRKLDNLTMRAPRNETFHSILRELYSAEEADFAAKLPYTLSTADRIAKSTGCDGAKVRRLLDGLCSKGLVMDLWIRGEFHYMLSPIVVGIFEFTMMRTGPDLDVKTWARLFHAYMQDDASLYAANCNNGERVSIIRTLPHEEMMHPTDYSEIMDYEKAASLIHASDRFAVGLCSCRHTMLHAGKKTCDVPLEKCSVFGYAAEFMIRRGLAREVSKTEMLENLARSRETGLVLNADNVRKNITFLCHCCGCCCHALLGISKFGYPNAIVTSTFLAESDGDLCTGCGKCARACPISAIEMHRIENPKTERKRKPEMDTGICLGCGVCALSCETGALKLVKRGKRVIHPETTFERVILQCLERGTLQNQLFDNPQSTTQKFMRVFVGAFLRLSPVKKALMSDTLRSSFLGSMKKGAASRGKGWMAEM